MLEFRVIFAEAKATPYTLLVPLDKVGDTSRRTFIDVRKTPSCWLERGGVHIDFSFKGGKLSSRLVFNKGARSRPRTAL